MASCVDHEHLPMASDGTRAYQPAVLLRAETWNGLLRGSPSDVGPGPTPTECRGDNHL
jgi:hypothetical protein